MALLSRIWTLDLSPDLCLLSFSHEVSHWYVSVGGILLFTSVNIAREVIVLHRARNTQIVPAQLGAKLSCSTDQSGRASLAPDPVSTAKIQTHFREDPEEEDGAEEFREFSEASDSSIASDAQTEINSETANDGRSKRHFSPSTGPPPTTTTTTTENSPPVGKPPVRELQSRDLKAVKVLGVTASVYFIAWGPYVVLVVLLSFFPHISVPGEIRFAFMWLANSNSFMNVFIYSLMYSGFRRNAVALFRTALAHLLSWCGIQMQIVKIGDINLHTQMSQMSAAESFQKSYVNGGICTGQSNT